MSFKRLFACAIGAFGSALVVTAAQAEIRLPQGQAELCVGQNLFQSCSLPVQQAGAASKTGSTAKESVIFSGPAGNLIPAGGGGIEVGTKFRNVAPDNSQAMRRALRGKRPFAFVNVGDGLSASRLALARIDLDPESDAPAESEDAAQTPAASSEEEEAASSKLPGGETPDTPDGSEGTPETVVADAPEANNAAPGANTPDATTTPDANTPGTSAAPVADADPAAEASAPAAAPAPAASTPAASTPAVIANAPAEDDGTPATTPAAQNPPEVVAALTPVATTPAAAPASPAPAAAPAPTTPAAAAGPSDPTSTTPAGESGPQAAAPTNLPSAAPSTPIEPEVLVLSQPMPSNPPPHDGGGWVPDGGGWHEGMSCREEDFGLDGKCPDVVVVPPTAAVPSPATLALFGIGLLGLGLSSRRGRNSKA